MPPSHAVRSRQVTEPLAQAKELGALLLQSSYFTVTYRRALRAIAHRKIGNLLPPAQRSDVVERWLTKPEQDGTRLVAQLERSTAALAATLVTGISGLLWHLMCRTSSPRRHRSPARGQPAYSRRR